MDATAIRPEVPPQLSSDKGDDDEKSHAGHLEAGLPGMDAKQAQKDKALAILAHNVIDFDPNSEEAKRVLRKIDKRIMPIIWLLYLLQLMDKNSLSFANIMGIRKDCNLTGSEYSWLGSIVYFGYLSGQPLVSFCMQRFPIAKYFGAMSIAWGAVVACHAACHNFETLAVVRFLLGFLEVCTAPVAIYLTGVFYTRQEQVTRAAIWYTCSGFANIFGGFIAAGFSQAPRYKWQGLFILYGGLTAGVGVWAFFFLAASPTECGFLTEREKAIALERVRGNKTGTEAWKFNASQLKEAFLDIRFYLVFILLVCTGLPNGGITAFGPEIIRQFGFTTLQSTLLNAGSGACTVVGTLLAWYISRWTGRTIAGVYTLLLAAIGCIMMLTIPAANNGGRYAGYILTLQYPICVLFIISFMTSSFSGTTKKVAVSAAYQIGYSVGNIVGPQTFRPSDAPSYPIAKWTMFAFILFGAFTLGGMGLLHKTWNKRRDARDAQDAANGIVHEKIENEEFADITDFNMRSFRYAL